jgi:hypothetical protein
MSAELERVHPRHLATGDLATSKTLGVTVAGTPTTWGQRAFDIDHYASDPLTTGTVPSLAQRRPACPPAGGMDPGGRDFPAARGLLRSSACAGW